MVINSNSTRLKIYMFFVDTSVVHQSEWDQLHTLPQIKHSQFRFPFHRTKANPPGHKGLFFKTSFGMTHCGRLPRSHTYIPRKQQRREVSEPLLSRSIPLTRNTKRSDSDSNRTQSESTHIHSTLKWTATDRDSLTDTRIILFTDGLIAGNDGETRMAGRYLEVCRRSAPWRCRRRRCTWSWPLSLSLARSDNCFLVQEGKREVNMKSPGEGKRFCCVPPMPRKQAGLTTCWVGHADVDFRYW